MRCCIARNAAMCAWPRRRSPPTEGGRSAGAIAVAPGLRTGSSSHADNRRMQYTQLGSTGLTVSRICLGMMTYGSPQWRPWVLDEAASRPLVKQAVGLGINFFDTADMYSAGESEVLTGKFLREFCQRDEVVIATKLFFPVDPAFKSGQSATPPGVDRPNRSGLSRKRIFHAVDASLK